MSIIFNIDTASEQAHVSLAKDDVVLNFIINESQKEHASFLQPAIKQLIENVGIYPGAIDAVAVTAGPGSYTGLRVGMASAKGLCYALKKPLIALSTLEVLTVSAFEIFDIADNEILFCPMMDARRMEVFTAIYKKDLSVVLRPCAMILNEHSFEKELLKSKILFFGSGSAKWKLISDNVNAVFETIQLLPKSMAKLSNDHFLEKNFTELAYSEPIYLKEFQIVINK